LNSLLDILTKNKAYAEPICHLYAQYSLIESLSYSEILNQSKNYAQNLKKRLRCTNEPILISLDTSKEFLFSFFGILISGNIPVPVSSNTLMLKNDYIELIEKIRTSCHAKFIISNMTFDFDIESIQPKDLTKESDEGMNLPSFQLDDICFIQYSSGSTRDPKGVAVSHGNILANLAQIKEGMKVTSRDKICSWLPLHHDMGLIGVLFASLYCRVESHLLSPLDFILSPQSWLKLISDHSISVIVAPNAAYSACTKKIKKTSFKDLDLSNIRLALSGAEPVNHKVCQQFIEHFKDVGLKENVIFPVYGLAEATLAVSFNDVGIEYPRLKINYDILTKQNKADTEVGKSDSIEIVSCGKALDQIEIQIRQPNKLAVDCEVGEIFIKGPNIVSSYYLQETHLQNDWLSTGDLGFLKDGLLYIVGRIKDLLIINGKNIAANDIEAKACELSPLKLGRTVAFSHFDSHNQESAKLVAEVCLLSLKERNKLKVEICSHLRSILPLKPEDIFLIPPLLIKKTTSGKVKRFHIKESFLNKRVSRWEKNFIILFYRSQILILSLKVKFFIFEKIRSLLHLKYKTKKESIYESTL